MSRGITRSEVNGWVKWADQPKAQTVYTNYEDEDLGPTSFIVQKRPHDQVELGLKTWDSAKSKPGEFRLGVYRLGDLRLLMIVQQVLELPASLTDVGSLITMMGQLSVGESRPTHRVIAGCEAIQKEIYTELGLLTAAADSVSVRAAVLGGSFVSQRPPGGGDLSEEELVEEDELDCSM